MNNSEILSYSIVTDFFYLCPAMKKSLQKNLKGWLALSPLAIFLVIYLLSSIISGDFYSVPVASAFLIASCYALMIFRGGSLGDRI